MGWEIHGAKAAFAEFAEDWDRLNARLCGRHPFFDSRFVGPLLDHFGDGRERLCIHRTVDGISGALILGPSGLGKWSSFCPSQVQAIPVLLDDACLLETLLAALPGLGWTLELYAVDPRYAPDFWRLSIPQIVVAHACSIGIEPTGEFTAYWRERPKNLAKNIGRYFRRAEIELSAPCLSTVVTPDDMDAAITRYGVLETAGWKGRAGTAIAGDNEQGAFYSEVLKRFALTGQAAIYELHIGSHLASSRLVLSNDRMIIILKTAYDETLARFAPGRLLLFRLIEEQFALPSRKTIDFYTNATRDQKEWSTFGYTIRSIQIFRSPLYAAVFSLLKAFRQNFRDFKTRRRGSNLDPLPVSVNTCKSIEDLTAGQYDLGEFSANQSLEASIDWLELLEKQVYADDPGVRYYLVADRQSPRVMLPVRLTKKGLVRSIESLSNYYTSLYAPLVGHDGDLVDLKDLLATAGQDHGDAHVMRFTPMDPDSSTYKALLSGLRANDWIPFQFFAFGNWFLKVDGTWQDYLKKRSANLRSSIRRRCKAFAADGGTLDIVTTLEQIEEAIVDFQGIYAASWKKPEPYPEFVPSLIRQLAARGMLRLGFARLNKRTIAAQLWIVDGNKASIYKVAYDEAFASYAPGTVLTAYLMQHVIEHDHVPEVDFLIGDDGYKATWMSDRRERWGIVAYNPRTIIGFALLVNELTRVAVKAVVERIRRALWQVLSISRRQEIRNGSVKRTVSNRPAGQK